MGTHGGDYLIEIPEYTKQDFQSSLVPYEFLYQYKDQKFLLKQLMSRMSDQAREVGVRNFVTIFNAYLSEIGGQDNRAGTNATNFVGQEFELWCGDWEASDAGIIGADRMGMEVTACYHPIMPVRRLVNVDTGIHKVQLAFNLGRGWRSVIEDRITISDGRSIVGLAKYGISVNSENSKHLVRFLAEVENLNRDIIPETASIGRLGWIDGYGFSPFDGELTFDGDEEYRVRFDAVKSHGMFEMWRSAMLTARSLGTQGGVVFRIVLAASFASVLAKPCGCLPFFIHLWGGTETGKTVALLVAASVWADSELGKYAQTFNATDVGKELGAAFFNSMPLIMDELQLIKDNRKEFDKMIYQLSEGVGRARGKKTGGLQKTPTWRNCVITNGEFPIISPNSGAGAVNRTIEIDCHDIRLFENPKATLSAVQENYGFAGEYFVRKLTEDGNLDKAKALQEEIIERMKTDDTMEKQTASVSLIMAADQLIDEWIFHDGVRLMPEDLRPFLVSKAQVNQNARAMDFLEDFVNINQSKFKNQSDYTGEVWGELCDDGGFYIIKSKFDDALGNEGYNSSAFIGWAREAGVLQLGRDGKSTKTKRIRGRVTRCVHLKPLHANALEDIDDEEYDDLPL